MKLPLASSLIIIITHTSFCQNVDKNEVKRYTKVPNGYLMVLRQGDNIFQSLENFAIQEKIPAANFSGMGFVDVTFGFFDLKTKQYDPKEFKGMELASMLGTIAWKDGKPSIHSHGVGGDKSFQAYGGHILSTTVSTGSVEIMIIIHDKPFQRKKDEALGADILEIE